MGRFQAIQPLVGKERVRPALMVRSPAAASLPLPFAKDAPQATPYPFIQRGERRFVAVFEILKPASQRRIQRRDDRLKARPIAPLRLRSDGVFDLLHALGSRES